MKVKIYVNWERAEIISEKEFIYKRQLKELKE